MTDMLENVARAIAEICNEKGQELASKYEAQASTIPWQAFEREAKAAIEAYREPTDEMVEVALLELSLLPNSGDAMRAALQSAADAALERKE